MFSLSTIQEQVLQSPGQCILAQHAINLVGYYVDSALSCEVVVAQMQLKNQLKYFPLHATGILLTSTYYRLAY